RTRQQPKPTLASMSPMVAAQTTTPIVRLNLPQAKMANLSWGSSLAESSSQLADETTATSGLQTVARLALVYVAVRRSFVWPIRLQSTCLVTANSEPFALRWAKIQ